jgi:hypothetical protein
MLLRPSVEDRSNVGTWWFATPALWEQFLRILGFKSFTIIHHRAPYLGRDVPLYTLVTRRSACPSK